MRTIYVAHPMGGKADLRRATRWVCWIYRNHPGVVAIAPDDGGDELLEAEDPDPAKRETALRKVATVARLADEVWLVGGRVTEAMRRAAVAGRAVRDMTELGPEPPTGSA
jgi:hypothetical protein